MQSSNHLLDNAEALRQQFAADGYLFIRSFHERARVLTARQDYLRNLQLSGRLASDMNLDAGTINLENKGEFFGAGGIKGETEYPAVFELAKTPMC